MVQCKRTGCASAQCRSPVGSQAVRGFDFILAFQSKAGKRLEVDGRLERASREPNRAHGGETPVSPIIYNGRLIYVSSLSVAFGKETTIFVSYSARQHRCPPPDIPLRLANYVKNASPDVIHLLMRTSHHPYSFRDSSLSPPPQPCFAMMVQW